MYMIVDFLCDYLIALNQAYLTIYFYVIAMEWESVVHFDDMVIN